MTPSNDKAGSGNVLVFPNAATAARKAAEIFAAAAAEAIESRGQFDVALAGGTTPRETYALLADKSQFGNIHWPKVRVWFTDERCVQPDDDACNHKMVRGTLLKHINVCPNCVHRMEGELTSVPAADLYEQELRDHLITENGRFDLVLLGLGADGHTASLFPETEALGVTDTWCFGNLVPQLDDERVTLTYPAINSARRVVFLVTGAAKAEAVAKTLKSPTDITHLPAQGVKPTNGEVIWVLDAEAGAAAK